MWSEGRCQEVSKRGDHITHSADCQDYSQYAGQERRLRNKVTDRDALNSEKTNADGKDRHLNFEAAKHIPWYLPGGDGVRNWTTIHKRQRRRRKTKEAPAVGT